MALGRSLKNTFHRVLKNISILAFCFAKRLVGLLAFSDVLRRAKQTNCLAIFVRRHKDSFIKQPHRSIRTDNAILKVTGLLRYDRFFRQGLHSCSVVWMNSIQKCLISCARLLWLKAKQAEQ